MTNPDPNPESIALISSAATMLERALEMMGAAGHPRLMRFKEAAKYYRVGVRTIVKYYDEIPGVGVEVGPLKFIDRSQLEKRHLIEHGVDK